jgi:GxxExxY protein
VDNILTGKVLKQAFKVHSALGPGLLESAYKECLYFELIQSGLLVEKEKPIPLIYNDVRLDCGYRIDLLVENELVLEIKTVDSIVNVHLAQVLTYMKVGGYQLGLILNFRVLKLKHGIRRLIYT